MHGAKPAQNHNAPRTPWQHLTVFQLIGHQSCSLTNQQFWVQGIYKQWLEHAKALGHSTWHWWSQHHFYTKYRISFTGVFYKWEPQILTFTSNHSIPTLTWQQVTHNTSWAANTRHTIPRESKDLPAPFLQTGWHVPGGLHCCRNRLGFLQQKPGQPAFGGGQAEDSTVTNSLPVTLHPKYGTAHSSLRSYWYVFCVKGTDRILNISASLYYPNPLHLQLPLLEQGHLVKNTMASDQ